MTQTRGKVLFVIAHENFRDEEYEEPRRVLEDEGCEVTVASTSLDSARGKLGLTVRPDVLLSEVAVAGYDAVVFVGGSGAYEYFHDPIAHQLATDAHLSGRVLGAICVAVMILAYAGLLRGKEATVFESEISALEAQGAIYTGHGVTRSGNIVTANGPQSAYQFGLEILNALS